MFSLFEEDQVNAKYLSRATQSRYFVNYVTHTSQLDKTCMHKQGLDNNRAKLYPTWSYVSIKATYINRIPSGGVSYASFCHFVLLEKYIVYGQGPIVCNQYDENALKRLWKILFILTFSVCFFVLSLCKDFTNFNYN